MMAHGHRSRSGYTPTYISWKAMRARCAQARRENAQYYIERGIGCSPRWASFENFLADMGERPAGMTLDRIDNDMSYYKGNCRWATPLEQRHNRRPHEQHNRGEGHPLAKLTVSDVQAIRALSGGLTQQAIAQRFGVGRRTIGKIISGDLWGSVQ